MYLGRERWGCRRCTLRSPVITEQPDPYNDNVRRQQALEGQVEVLNQ